MTLCKPVALLLGLSTASLAAWGGKTDANEKNFGAALAHYFDQKGTLCLGTRHWPLDLSEMDLRMHKTMAGGRAGQMAALEAAGLVKGEDAEVEVRGFNGKPMPKKAKVRRYTLTDAAKPFAVEREVDAIGLGTSTKVRQTDLCWGKKALGKVLKWDGPMKLGDYQEASVSYTYAVNNTAPWAQRPDVQAAFPAVKIILDAAGTKPGKHAVKLTSQGWEAKGLD